MENGSTPEQPHAEDEALDTNVSRLFVSASQHDLLRQLEALADDGEPQIVTLTPDWSAVIGVIRAGASNAGVGASQTDEFADVQGWAVMGTGEQDRAGMGSGGIDSPDGATHPSRRRAEEAMINDADTILLTTHEVADRAKVSYYTVRRWVADGKLPVTRLGRNVVRHRLTDVDAFIRSRSTGIPSIEEVARDGKRRGRRPRTND